MLPHSTWKCEQGLLKIVAVNSTVIVPYCCVYLVHGLHHILCHLVICNVYTVCLAYVTITCSNLFSCDRGLVLFYMLHDPSVYVTTYTYTKLTCPSSFLKVSYMWWCHPRRFWQEQPRDLLLLAHKLATRNLIFSFRKL